jgi:hypothetical protein
MIEQTVGDNMKELMKLIQAQAPKCPDCGTELTAGTMNVRYSFTTLIGGVQGLIAADVEIDYICTACGDRLEQRGSF